MGRRGVGTPGEPRGGHARRNVNGAAERAANVKNAAEGTKSWTTSFWLRECWCAGGRKTPRDEGKRLHRPVASRDGQS